MFVLPYLLHFRHFALPTFGVLTAVGLMLGLALSQSTARMAGVDPEALWDAGLFAVIAAFVLSRLLLVVENFATFQAFPMLMLTVPSLTASGLMLTGVATWGWLRWRRVPVLPAMDAWAPCGALVWGFLALGHWAEGSDPGMARRPVALYAFAVAIVLMGAAYGWLGGKARLGTTAGLTLIGAGVGQYFLSFVREPGVSGWGGLDVLQWVALGMVVAGGVLLVVAKESDEAGV